MAVSGSVWPWQARRHWLKNASLGDLFGVTSFLLSAVAPDAARSVRLDTYYPVGGLKRYVDDDLGFEFLYPSQEPAPKGRP